MQPEREKMCSACDFRGQSTVEGNIQQQEHVAACSYLHRLEGWDGIGNRIQCKPQALLPEGSHTQTYQSGTKPLICKLWRNTLVINWARTSWALPDSWLELLSTLRWLANEYSGAACLQLPLPGWRLQVPSTCLVFHTGFRDQTRATCPPGEHFNIQAVF